MRNPHKLMERWGKIWTRRGRTPIRATHRFFFIEQKRKSRAGVEYTKNVPVIRPI